MPVILCVLWSIDAFDRLSLTCIGGMIAGGTNEVKASRQHKVQLDLQSGASHNSDVDDDRTHQGLGSRVCMSRHAAFCCFLIWRLLRRIEDSRRRVVEGLSQSCHTTESTVAVVLSTVT